MPNIVSIEPEVQIPRAAGQHKQKANPGCRALSVLTLRTAQ